MERLKKDILGFKLPLYIATALLLIAGYLIINNYYIDVYSIHLLMLVSVFGLVLFAARKGRYQILSDDEILFYIVLAGCIVRIGYTLYNSAYVRAHDMSGFEDLYGVSKASYLMQLVQLHQLPQSNDVQLYHQPFSYIVSAVFCLAVQPFLKSDDVFYLGNAGKLASCFASCGILFMIPKLCRCLEMKEKGIRYTTLLVAAFPVFFLISGRIGEDAFSCFFALAAILYTLYWHKEASLKNTVFLAVIYGLGLQTNLSCALPAVFTVMVFIYHLASEKEKRGRLLCLYVLFGVISLPLGLWFYIRNYVLFGQSFTYIYPQVVGSDIWCGDVSLWNRYKLLDIKNILASPFNDPYSDYNLATYFLKSELFGEFTFSIPVWVPYILLAVNLLITAFAAGYCIYGAVKRRLEKNRCFIIGIALFDILFVMYSFWKYPFGCSMDARYFTVITVLKAVIIGFFLSDAEIMEQKKQGPAAKAEAVFSTALQYLIMIFAVFSFAMFCFIV